MKKLKNFQMKRSAQALGNWEMDRSAQDLESLTSPRVEERDLYGRMRRLMSDNTKCDVTFVVGDVSIALNLETLPVAYDERL